MSWSKKSENFNSLSLVERCYVTAWKDGEWTSYFWRSLLLHLFSTQTSTTSAELVLLEHGKECFFINLVVWQHIVMVHQRIQEILLSWNRTLGSWPSNYFSVLQALLVGNGSKSPPLSSAEGCTGHYFGISKVITIPDMCNYFLFWVEMQTFWGETKTQPVAMNTEVSFRIGSPHISIRWK